MISFFNLKRVLCAGIGSPLFFFSGIFSHPNKRDEKTGEKKKKKRNTWGGVFTIIRDLYTIVELRLNLSFEKKKKKIADLEKKFFAFFGELGC